MYLFVSSDITKDQIFAISGSLKESYLKWVELPQDSFNGSAIGAVILLPRLAINLTQEILVYNLGAGWGSSVIITSLFDDGTGFTTSVVGEHIHTDEKPFNRSTPIGNDNSLAESEARLSVINFDRPFFPEKPIIVTELWANYLNPFMPALNTTVIDALMSTCKPAGDLSPRQRVLVAKWALGGLLANGLASIGATSTLQGNIKTAVKPDGSSAIDGESWVSGKRDMFIVDPEESKGWVKLRVESTINGYAYNIRGASPKVAISFLLAYCIVALSHVLYAGVTGVSSTCWALLGLHWRSDSISHELHTHHPPQEHCAGIMELNIFKLPVRVFAIRDGEGDGEHLELVFGNLEEKDVRGTPIKPNRVYGTLPKIASK